MFWMYAIVVFLYGIVETLNANWATLYLTSQRGVSAQAASWALTAFWVLATVGRLLFAALSSRISMPSVYAGLPFLSTVAFQVVSRANTALAGVVAFGLAGLACSAFLPLSISFAGNAFPGLAAVMSGELITFYQLGYGAAAFGRRRQMTFSGAAPSPGRPLETKTAYPVPGRDQLRTAFRGR